MTCLLALCLIGATAVDGDTIKHHGQNYRIWGIDAPERADPAGPAATPALRQLITGQPLTCTERDVDCPHCDALLDAGFGCNMEAIP